MTLPHPPSELFRKFIRFGGARLPLPRTLWPGLPSSRLQYTYTDGLPAEYCESFSPRPGSIFSLSLTLLTFHPGCLKLFWRQHVWTTAGFSINPLQNWMKWSSFLECIWLERRAGSWAWTCTTFMTAVKVSVRKGTRLRLTLMLVLIIIKMVTWWCWMLDVFHNLSVHEKYQISYVRVPITDPSLVLSWSLGGDRPSKTLQAGAVSDSRPCSSFRTSAPAQTSYGE